MTNETTKAEKVIAVSKLREWIFREFHYWDAKRIMAQLEKLSGDNG